MQLKFPENMTKYFGASCSKPTNPPQQLHWNNVLHKWSASVSQTKATHMWHPRRAMAIITSGRWGRWMGWYSGAISCASPAGEVSDDGTCLEQCSAGNEFPGCHNQMYRWRKWTTPEKVNLESGLFNGERHFSLQNEICNWSKCYFLYSPITISPRNSMYDLHYTYNFCCIGDIFLSFLIPCPDPLSPCFTAFSCLWLWCYIADEWRVVGLWVALPTHRAAVLAGLSPLPPSPGHRRLDYVSPAYTTPLHAF